MNGPRTHHPRPRATSFLSRVEPAPSQPSPLAQIYQPLVIDEIREEDQPQPGTRDALSYGPATRRRLSSMIKRPTDNLKTNTAQSTALRGFSTVGPRPGLSTTLSTSPGQQRQDWQSDGPETATEAEEKESTLGAVQLSRRLDVIEERQKRIEELLVGIARNIDSRSDT
jgi:hypothetical protein